MSTDSSKHTYVNMFMASIDSGRLRSCTFDSSHRHVLDTGQLSLAPSALFSLKDPFARGLLFQQVSLRHQGHACSQL